MTRPSGGNSVTTSLRSTSRLAAGQGVEADRQDGRVERARAGVDAGRHRPRVAAQQLVGKDLISLVQDGLPGDERSFATGFRR